MPFIDFLKKKKYPFGHISSKLEISPADVQYADEISSDRKVFYFVRPANRENAPHVVFFNGGPGMAASEMYARFNYEGFLPNYNVIFFDQRGTGLSFDASVDLADLKYFSARQIACDAELIRYEILGEGTKWIAFGQSYGGVVLRKYLELFPQSVVSAISHGSGIYDGVAVAVETEKGLMTRWKAFFENYPERSGVIEKLSAELSDLDEIRGEAFSLKGSQLVHLLAIFYTVLSDADMDKFLSSLDPKNLSKSYLEKINPIAQLVLGTGNLNRVIAFIDLLNGKTDEEVNALVIPAITGADWYTKKYPSKIGLEDAIVPVSKDFFEIETMFKNKAFLPDGSDMNAVSKHMTDHGFDFYIYGSEEDVLAFDSVKKEELLTSQLKNDRFKYRYSNGHHREWLTNPELFADILSKSEKYKQI